jgi:hypothetical protein
MAEHTPQTAPWEALGFEKRDVDATAASAVASFTGPPPHELQQIAMMQRAVGINPPPTLRDSSGWELPPDAPEGVWSDWIFGVHVVASNTFALGALGVTIDHPVLQDWREAGRHLVAAALYYFFGPWRETSLWNGKLIDCKQARRELPWISYYRYSLTIALSLSDWVSADRLLEWPGPDLNDDEGLDDRTAEDNAYQIWLAMRLRGETGSEVDSRRDLIVRRSRQRPKLLALAADALFAAETEQFAKTLADYLKYYRKREIDLRPKPYGRLVRDGICLDGTILWHLSRRRGMGEIPLSEELMIMIARP